MSEQHLPKRVQGVIDRCKSGQRLCKSIRFKESGDAEVLFFFEPSGKRAGPKSAQEAIASGKLSPLGDGLFDAGTSQTWVSA